MRFRAKVALIAGFGAWALVHVPGAVAKRGARTPRAAGLAGEIATHLDDLKACYHAELAQKPGLAGRVDLHLSVRGDGTVAQATIENSRLANPAVEGCIVAAARAWKLSPRSDGQEIHTAFPLELAPSTGGAAEVPLPPGLLARHVLDRSAVAFSPDKQLLVYNRCWTAASAPGAAAAGAAREPQDRQEDRATGCVVVFAPFGGGASAEEIPVFGPGDATDARARKRRETAAWSKLQPRLKGAGWVELTGISWSASGDQMAIPALGVALVWSKGNIRVVRDGSRAAVIGEIKTDSAERAHPIAAYSAPDHRVVVVAIREPTGTSASVTHFQVIGIGTSP